MKRLFKDCSCCGTYMRIDVDDKLYIRLKLLGLIHEENKIFVICKKCMNEMKEGVDEDE